MRGVVAVLLTATAVFAIACNADPRQPGHDPDPPTAHPEATAVPAVPNPGAQPEAPAADPGPHNTASSVQLKVAWIGERAGWITVYVNGVPRPQIKAPRPERGSRYYTGAWETDILIDGTAVTSVGVAWAPDVAHMAAQCTVSYVGIVKNHQGVDSGPCAANWTVAR